MEEKELVAAGEATPTDTLAETVAAEVLLSDVPQPGAEDESASLKAILEAIVYITDEPLTAQQIAQALNRPLDQVQAALSELTADYAQPSRGLTIREVAGGYKMATKPEHHEVLRAFVKNLKPPLKLSLAALETLAVIAYKQPITAPEIQEIRGVQGTSALKTLLDRKLIAVSGRKNVVGKPMLYKTTREFLIQFGLKDLSELPTLKEFEELSRLAFSDGDAEASAEEMAGAATSEAREAIASSDDAFGAPAQESTAPEANTSASVAEPEQSRDA
jgi:segregation and condensation protein B